MNEQTKIGVTLSLLARKNGVTQTDVATAIGISRISVNRFFRGHTQLRAEDFIKVCRFLGVNIEMAIHAKLFPEVTAA